MHVLVHIYRITAVLKVETDNIASIAASPTGRAVILVIMYVEIFKTGVILLIGDVKMCLLMTLYLSIPRVHRDRDRMVVEFTTTYAISAYHHLSCELESRSWRGVLDTTLYDKVCQ